jgi:TolA-binding protein
MTTPSTPRTIRTIGRLAWFATLGRRDCPPGWKLTRSASSGAPDPEIENHLAACATCAARSERHDALVAEARNLSAPAGMSEQSRAEISARLLAAPPRRVTLTKALPRRSPVMTAAVASAAAATIAVAIAALVVRDHAASPAPAASVPAPPATSRASIRAIGDARFARVQPPPDEIVRLDDGRIELDVVPLARGERFRVATDNGEVEVRGTSFEVLAADRQLRAVSVSRGRVEVRSGGGGLAILDAGDRWEKEPAAPPVTPVARAPHPSHSTHVADAAEIVEVAPRRSAPGIGSPARQRPSAIESALFDSGWASLRAGNARDAAETFGELERRARGRAIQEDALYWRAVATARCKETESAGRLFREFLAKFPRSARRGEAAVALGWILFDAGEIGEARRAFQQAASDPVAGVRASAAAGLRRTTRP